MSAKFDNLKTGVNLLYHIDPFPFIQKNVILFYGIHLDNMSRTLRINIRVSLPE